MKPILLIDFGSTYTKATCVDVDSAQLLGTAQSYTTVEEDISIGLENALDSCGRRRACASLRSALRVPRRQADCA